MDTKIVPPCFLTAYILHINFCTISLTQHKIWNFSKVLEKLSLQSPPAYYVPKSCINIIFQSKHIVQKILYDFMKQSNIELSEEFWENGILAIPSLSLLFLMICNLHVLFCAISSSRNRAKLIQIILEKVCLQRHMLYNFYQKLIDINIL